MSFCYEQERKGICIVNCAPYCWGEHSYLVRFLPCLLPTRRLLTHKGNHQQTTMYPGKKEMMTLPGNAQTGMYHNISQLLPSHMQMRRRRMTLDTTTA